MKKDIKLLAIDLAKEVFQVQGVDEKGRVVLKKKLTRQELPVFTANLPACRIVMESCGGSHYWARCFKSQGHQVDLIAAQHVSPFRRSRQKMISMMPQRLPRPRKDPACVMCRQKASRLKTCSHSTEFASSWLKHAPR